MAGRKDKSPLRTSRQVYDQIRWDPALDERAFTIGYEERFAGLTELPFQEFPNDGTIPWHRVWHVRVGALVVWSRRERVDLLHGTGDTETADTEAVLAAIATVRAQEDRSDRAQASARRRRRRRGASGRAEPEPELQALPVYGFDRGRARWIPRPVDAATRGPAPEALTLVTLNVLFDLYDADRLETARRTPALLRALREAKADVIALQEVTPRLLAVLEDTEWVRRGYVISESSRALDHVSKDISEDARASTVSPYGQLLLSRLPMRCHVATLRGHKRLIIGELELGGRRVLVPTLHLTSDRAEDAAIAREDELASALAVLDRLDRADPSRAAACALLGDFNTREGALLARLEKRGFVDLWPSQYPDDPGMTFDPRVNGLAAITSRTQRPGRLDRVMLRAPTDEAGRAWLSPVDISMCAAEPIDAPALAGLPLYPSDHFGLCALLQLQASAPARATIPTALREAAPVHRTALAVIPPASTWPEIQAIRAQHDRAYARWMPHINLLYGFVPDELLAEAAAALARALAETPRFTVTLTGFCVFRRRRGATVWLEPRCDPPDALRQLQAALSDMFPRCDEQRTKSRAGFTPHLTVAQLPADAPREELLQRWGAGWEPIRFTVDALALISRRGDDPFVVRHAIPLAPAPATPTPPPEPPPPDEPVSARTLDELSALLERACARCIHGAEAPPAVRHIHIIGSHRLGAATVHSDLDLVCVGPSWLPRARLFERLPARLRAAGHHVVSRAVEHARTPRLELELDGQHVDVQYVRTPEGTPLGDPRALPPAARAALDDASRRSLLAMLDADAVIELATQRFPGGLASFQATLRRLRQWTRARDIDANALGFPGGLAWALLLLDAAPELELSEERDDDARALALFASFLRVRAARSLRAPVSFAAAPPPPGRRHDEADSPMQIFTPAPPARNCVAASSRPTLAVVERELARATALLRGRAHPDEDTIAELLRPADPRSRQPAHPQLVQLTARAPSEAGLAGCRGWLLGHIVGLLVRLDAAARRAARASPEGPLLRPYSRPSSGDGEHALRYTVGLNLRCAAEIIEPARARLLADFASWAERPEGAELTLELA